jgi:glycolate oxidase iron-sulfur subunit
VNEQDLIERLGAATDQCVKCGLCLPHCPTYRERREEAESPRGRIALIQGWAEGQIAESPRLRQHLDNCLECRACERACPSLVGFGALMDDARALAARRGTPLGQLWRRAWLRALSSRAGGRAALLLARAYRASSAAHLARWSGLVSRPFPAALHRLALQLQRLPNLGPGRAPTEGAANLDLFLGCIGRAAQPGAIEAAIQVLTHLGYRVQVPPDQACCGAMLRHNGLPDDADRFLARNAAAFDARPAVGIASACVAELRTHDALGETQEICRFLADLCWPRNTRLRPLPARVAVHEPCSQRNMLRDENAAYDLLRRIPGIEPLPLPDNAFCCGAAGTYLLQHPEMSRTLLAPKIAALPDLGVELLVTTNTGCALHLAAGIAEAGLEILVLHPVELIARQLAD